MALHCQRCDIRGGEDLSFMWFAKTFEVRSKSSGVVRKRTLWLCPDCANEVGSVRKCTAFLREVLKR